MSNAALSILALINRIWGDIMDIIIPGTGIPFGLLWLTILSVPIFFKYATSTFDGSVGPGKSTDKGGKRK